MIYEELHPETKHGVNQHSSTRQVGGSSDRFTTETASATGKSERVVQRDAERALLSIGLADGRDAGRVLMEEGLAQPWPNVGNVWCE